MAKAWFLVTASFSMTTPKSEACEDQVIWADFLKKRHSDK